MDAVRAPSGSGDDRAPARDDFYRLAFEHNPHPMWVFDPAMLRFLAVNEAAVRQYGYTVDEFLSMTLADIRPPEDLPKLLDAIEHHVGDFTPTGDWRHMRKDGTVFDVEISSHDLEFDGRAARVVMATDVTERRRAQRRLEAQSRVARALASQLPASDAARAALGAVGTAFGWGAGRLWNVEAHGQVLRCETAWGDPALATGEVVAVAKAPARLGLAVQVGSARAEWAGNTHALAFAVHSGGRVRAVAEFFGCYPAELDAETIETLNGIGVHLGEYLARRETEQRLEHQALHDSLTGLPGRALFTDRLEQALARARRSRPSVVLFADLDNFKLINDSLGHATGDAILVALAERLRSSVRPMDTVARLGGDEFVMLLDGVDNADDARRLMERIVAGLGRGVDAMGAHHVITASIGATITTGDELPGDVIQDADAAMYRAKANGGARWEFFQPSQRRPGLSVYHVDVALRGAVERDELSVVYQPLVELAGGRVAGCEALLRWNHGGLGPVSPVEFIPVAEQTGLIVPIGAWALTRACTEAMAWIGRLPGSRLAVNLSARQLHDPDVVETVARALAESGFPPSQLDLEITETALLAPDDAPLETLLGFKALGLGIVLDDFGTGYSSLSHLKHFPIDRIKIDRAFVSGVLRSEEDQAIIAAVVGIGRALGLSVTAEGIEHESQAQRLAALGCDFGQGYHFGRPVGATVFAGTLAG
jgi:diguanylate cyclase (GGDEF)-like protein/PAS domain S-box-containing protein